MIKKEKEGRREKFRRIARVPSLRGNRVTSIFPFDEKHPCPATMEALIINISTRRAPVTKEAGTRKMILHAQFFKRSKSIQIILAPRNFETRCGRRGVTSCAKREYFGLFLKYYIPSKKKKKKKRKKIRSSPSRPLRGTGVREAGIIHPRGSHCPACCQSTLHYSSREPNL